MIYFLLPIHNEFTEIESDMFDVQFIKYIYHNINERIIAAKIFDVSLS